MATLQVLQSAYSDVSRLPFANIPAADLTALQTLAGRVDAATLSLTDARIEIAKMGGDSFDRLRTDLDAVTRFQKNVFHAQIRAVQGVERYVSDRAFDNIAYAAENAACGTAAAMWRSPACRRYVRGIADTVRRCEGAVFFVRPGVALARDGDRKSVV